MRLSLSDWNAYWAAREAAISRRIGLPYRVPAVDRFDIMSAQLFEYSEEVVARDLRPEDFVRYGLPAPGHSALDASFHALRDCRKCWRGEYVPCPPEQCLRRALGTLFHMPAEVKT